MNQVLAGSVRGAFLEPGPTRGGRSLTLPGEHATAPASWPHPRLTPSTTPATTPPSDPRRPHRPDVGD